MQKILDTASIARGEVIDWEVQGFESYDIDSLTKDIEEYKASEDILFSPTFTIEGQKALSQKASEAIGIPRKFWQQIKDEIDEGAVLLSSEQLQVLLQTAVSGFLTPKSLLERLKQAQILDENIDIDAELASLGISNLSAVEGNGNIINEALDLSE